MNERIFELAEQADEYAEQTVHYYQGQFDGLTWKGKIKQVRDKKFAELIVRECAERFEEYWNDAGWQRMYNPTEYVNEHFGVE